MIIHIQSFPDHNRVYNTNIYICSLQLSIYLIGFFFVCVCFFCFFFFNSEQFPPGYVIIVTVAVADSSAEQ